LRDAALAALTVVSDRFVNALSGRPVAGHDPSIFVTQSVP
jgi:hypothetical protein